MEPLLVGLSLSPFIIVKGMIRKFKRRTLFTGAATVILILNVELE